MEFFERFENDEKLEKIEIKKDRILLTKNNEKIATFPIKENIENFKMSIVKKGDNIIMNVEKVE